MTNNKKETALFICNERYLDDGQPEGGVKFCTDEFRALLRTGFEVRDFPVSYSASLGYRIRKKTGFSAYDDYNTEKYRLRLVSALREQKIRYVFLNLTNTAPFAKLIKTISREIKVILCSHGNESGDFLHDISTHDKFKGIKKATSSFTLGKMLTREAEQRKYIDLVLTVSDVEEGIEKWLGTTAVYMVPRFIDKHQAPYHPIKGLTGFLADLSHEPNFYGISSVCKALQKKDPKGIEIHLAGGGAERGKALAAKYPFIKYLGYLSNEALLKEIGNWTFALNPVFYYSRGVSTKLGKSLGWGMPVITTNKGMRGYLWGEGEMPVCNNAEEMASLIAALAVDMNACNRYRGETLKIQHSAPSYEMMMNDILKLL